MKKTKLKKTPLIIIFLLVVSLVSLFGFKSFFIKDEEVIKLEKQAPKNLSLLLLGDIFLNQNIIKDSIVEINEYDFKYIFEDVKDVFDNYDLKHYFQKNIISDSNNFNNFRAPQAISNNMIEYGFNLVSLSNSNIINSNDIEESTKYWDTKNVVVSGYKKEDKIHTINDVTYGFFSYTTEKNNKVKYYEQETVKKEIEKIKDNVDLVIVSIDWKESYSEEPTLKQEEIAKELSDMGVNIIIGSNSSNIKPIEVINNTIVFYSLGNFLIDTNVDFSISAICSIDLKITDDKIDFDFIKVDLAYVYSNNKTNFKIKSFDNLNDEILDGYKTYHNKYSDILSSKNNKVIITKIGD